MSCQLELADEAASNRFAKKLAACLHKGLVLTFSGDLGAGKTSIIRSMLRGLGVSGAIKSPSYSLVESYPCEGLTLHHFDLYRIQDEYELDYLGFRDFFTEDAVCCIEWPEKAGQNIAKIDLNMSLSIYGEGRRLLIQACSEPGEDLLHCLKE